MSGSFFVHKKEQHIKMPFFFIHFYITINLEKS